MAEPVDLEHLQEWATGDNADPFDDVLDLIRAYRITREALDEVAYVVQDAKADQVCALYAIAAADALVRPEVTDG